MKGNGQNDRKKHRSILAYAPLVAWTRVVMAISCLLAITSGGFMG